MKTLNGYKNLPQANKLEWIMNFFLALCTSIIFQKMSI